MENNISVDKKYRTESGIRVKRILCTDGIDTTYPVVIELENGSIRSYTADGTTNCVFSYFDLVEISPYDDFKIDDPVMVRLQYTHAPWQKRYFAGVAPDGKVITWNNGMTSWSTGSQPADAIWHECRKPTAEELKT